MIKAYSCYLVSTGEITGKRITASLDILTINTAPGEAWIMGTVDPYGQRVELHADDFGNVVVPTVVRFVPPEPAATQWSTWSWDDAAHRWIATPTLAVLQQQATLPVFAQLRELDT